MTVSMMYSEGQFCEHGVNIIDIQPIKSTIGEKVKMDMHNLATVDSDVIFTIDLE